MTTTSLSVTASATRIMVVPLLAAGLLLAGNSLAWADRGDRHGRYEQRYEHRYDDRKGGRHHDRYDRRNDHRWHKSGVVRELPRGYKKVIVNKNPYYVHGHRYYNRVHNGYVLVAPPVGSIFATLPFGAVNVTIGGNFFYRSGDVYLRPAPRGYVVVDPWARPTWHIAGTFW